MFHGPPTPSPDSASSRMSAQRGRCSLSMLCATSLARRTRHRPLAESCLRAGHRRQSLLGSRGTGSPRSSARALRAIAAKGLTPLLESRRGIHDSAKTSGSRIRVRLPIPRTVIPNPQKAAAPGYANHADHISVPGTHRARFHVRRVAPSPALGHLQTSGPPDRAVSRFAPEEWALYASEPPFWELKLNERLPARRLRQV